MKITYQQVEQNIAKIANRSNYTVDFLYELLAAYGRSPSAITQLRQGVINKAIDKNAVLQKDVVYLKTYSLDTELIEKIEKLENDPLTERYQPRYLITTDLVNIAAKDTKKNTTLTIKIADIDQQIAFFYGWTGDEVTDDKHEAVVDRRAADKMKELYSEIEKENLVKFTKESNTFRHDLNVFFSRLLFCFFAEDTDLFKKKQFTDAIKNYTNTDGSDLNVFFTYLFKALDSETKSGLSTPFSDFPYVNGSIFDTTRHAIAIPDFNAQARHLILECAKSNWGEINPDIFGTIFQSIVDGQKRDESGMDYTSVPNILKVIEPLFLEELRELFDKYYDDVNKLLKLLIRISKIKIFDPACGSGNFLIISYKEIRRLAHAIIARLNELSPTHKYTGFGLTSLIKLENFYGIEIDDFAHEIAVLSLYLAAHQMNVEFEKQFGKKISIIPLIDIPTIIHGNAARLDWQRICPNIGHMPTKTEQQTLISFNDSEQQELPVAEKIYDEIYLIGNPPYKGGKKIKNPIMKGDVKLAQLGMPYSKNIDYISIWFFNAGRYIKGTDAKFAFVSTNSICQGEQVGMFWPYLLNDLNLDIIFGYTSFKWQNSARDNAGVTCIIVGVANIGKVKKKTVYSNGLQIDSQYINAYLIPNSPNIIVDKSMNVLFGIPKMTLGSMPKDGGGLVLTPDIKKKIEDINPETTQYIKQYMGSDEFIRGQHRYCLWIDDSDVNNALNYPEIAKRIEIVREYRSNSEAESTRDFASLAHRFIQRAYKPTNSIIVPRVSSERREYIPMSYLNKNTVISDAANAIYDAELWLFAILESKMHMAWIRTVCGKLKTDYRYSSTLGYNTFPVPLLTDAQKEKLKQSARKILLTRENHSEKTLANMYDPDKMPSDLREAHNENDIIVDQLYRKKGFNSDEERLTILFDLYEQIKEKPSRS